MSDANEVLVVGLPIAEAPSAPAVGGIRSMTEADLAQLVTLWLESYPGDVTGDVSADDVADDWRAAFAGEYGELSGGASLVIEAEGRVVAAVQTVIDAVWPETPAGPFIIEVIVLPRFRGRGLARSLLSAALVHLARSGHASAALRVDVDNRAAQSLYRSLGFTPAG